MKIESLFENNSNSLDPANLQEFPFSHDTVMAIQEYFKGLSGFKITDVDVSQTELNIYATNNILDASLLFTTYGPPEDEKFELFSELSIADKMLAVPGSTSMIRNSGYNSEIFTESGIEEFLKKFGPEVADAAEKVTDWYFDVSGKYGKLKIMVIRLKSHNTHPKLFAVGGDMDLNNFQGTVL